MIVTLSITFTPQVTSNHRVCYKKTTDVSYDCSNIIAAVSGIPVTASINVTVPSGTESCDPITFEGYVQPTCEPEASPLNRTSFPNMTYTPDNPCLFWEATCAPGVDAVDVIDVGSGYTPGSTIIPTITGDGAGAAAVCYVTDGTIIAVPLTITNPGSLYNDGFYSLVTLTNISSSGINGKVEVQVIGGQITNAIRYETYGGTGYAIGDTVTIDPTTGGMGGVGSGAIITLDPPSVESGTIDYCELTASGSGYITVGATITGNAVLDVILADCDETYVFGEDCDGNTVGPYVTDPSGKLLPGQIINMCHSKSLPDPVPDVKNTWSVEQRTDLCCYDCEQVTVTLASGNYGTFNYEYINCSTLKSVQTSLVYVGGEVPGPLPVVIICYVKGSLVTDPNIIILGPVPCSVI